MPDDSDLTLLRNFAKNRDGTAFAEVVRRRLDGVYSSALRRTGGDVHLAQDVVQEVFIALARKADRLINHPDLVGWLYTCTRHEAANVVRTERRRKVREQKAHAMPEDSPLPQVDWNRIAPLLDDAIEHLGPTDRSAILLRFSERRPFAEIGALLQLSEDAARRRVERALDKLRAWLERKGVASTAAALGLALEAHATTAAPAGLAGSVAGAALAASAKTGAVLLWGSFFAMTKLKTGIAAVAAFGAAIVFHEVHASREFRNEIARYETANNEVAGLRAAQQQVATTFARVAPDDSTTQELARLRQRIAQLKVRPDGVLDSEMKPIDAYTNKGWATPRAAYETQLWARTHGHPDEFVTAFGWSPEGKAKMDRFFTQLPKAVRAKYGIPEKMLAPDNHYGAMGDLVALQIFGQTAYGNSVRVQAWGKFSSGREISMDMLMKNFDGVWRVPITDEQTDRWIAEINPATGERSPAK